MFLDTLMTAFELINKLLRDEILNKITIDHLISRPLDTTPLK